MARRSSLRRTSSKAKTEMGKYCGKYVFSELLVCSECGSPYRRVTWMPTGEKRYVWRCINRLEHGKRICKHSATLEETALQEAVVAALNEMFRQREAREIVTGCVASALAGAEEELSLPTVEAKPQSLQARQVELLQMVMAGGVGCIDYDEELQRVTASKSELLVKKAELEHEGRTAGEFDRRMEEIDRALKREGGAIEAFDEVLVRQLVSNIEVLDRDRILVRFKDGTEVEQVVGCAAQVSA